MQTSIAMTCPKCHSSDLKKISLIYADGVHKSRGRFVGWFLGAGVGLGRYRGATQSRLSAMLRPPRKFPYGLPIVLWFLGFFPLMALIGRGKLSWTMGLIATVYVFLLPAIPVGAFAYNFFVYPGKYARWDATLLCQHCGEIGSSLTGIRVRVQLRI
jgi:hypothetical protein